MPHVLRKRVRRLLTCSGGRMAGGRSGAMETTTALEPGDLLLPLDATLTPPVGVRWSDTREEEEGGKEKAEMTKGER